MPNEPQQHRYVVVRSAHDPFGISPTSLFMALIGFGIIIGQLSVVCMLMVAMPSPDWWRCFSLALVLTIVFGVWTFTFRARTVIVTTA